MSGFLGGTLQKKGVATNTSSKKLLPWHGVRARSHAPPSFSTAILDALYSLCSSLFARCHQGSSVLGCGHLGTLFFFFLDRCLARGRRGIPKMLSSTALPLHIHRHTQVKYCIIAVSLGQKRTTSVHHHLIWAWASTDRTNPADCGGS